MCLSLSESDLCMSDILCAAAGSDDKFVLFVIFNNLSSALTPKVYITFCSVSRVDIYLQPASSSPFRLNRSLLLTRSLLTARC